MRCYIAGYCICYASIEIPGSGVIHQAARRVPGTRLILQMSDLQINPDPVVFIDGEGGNRDGDHSRIYAKFQIRAIATMIKKKIIFRALLCILTI